MSVTIFLQWFQAKGGLVDSRLEIREQTNNGRGVFINDSVKTDTPLMSVPFNVLLNVNQIIENEIPQLGNAVKQIQDALDDRLLLIISLIWNRFSQNSEAFWKDYVGVIPNTFSTTMWFDEEERTFLRGTQLETVTDLKTVKMKQEYAKVQQLIQGLAPTEFMNVFTFENFLWADAAYWTRVLSVPMDDKESIFAKCMVPFVDMCNHTVLEHATSYWALNHQKKMLILFARNDLQKDTEIFINYGDKTNEELMYQYGFATPNNTFEDVAILCPFMPEDPLLPQKIQLVKSCEMIPCLFIKQLSLTESSMNIARLCVADEDEFGASAERFKKWKETKSWVHGPVSDMNEVRTFNLVKWLMDQRMEEMLEGTGTMEEDEELLKKLDSMDKLDDRMWKLKNSVIYRLQQKKVLMAATELFEAAQTKFFEQPHIQQLLAELESQNE